MVNTTLKDTSSICLSDLALRFSTELHTKPVVDLPEAGLKKNKHGNIVSRAKSAKGAQMLKRLTNKGYFTRKGKFGYVKKAAKKTRKAHGKKKVKAIRGVKWEDRNRKTGRFAKKPSYKKRK